MGGKQTIFWSSLWEDSRKAAFQCVFALVAVFLLSFYLTVPAVEKLPLCFFHSFTHLECPGCGLLRSFISISHGQWIRAIRWNALGPLVYLFLVVYLIKALVGLAGKKIMLPPFLFQRGTWTYRLFGILFWGQWILKLGKGLLS
jgi:uncharacterized protein DUF2752